MKTLILILLVSLSATAQNLHLKSTDGTYLGCLDCPQHDVKSIHNVHGMYGSDLSPVSIFNKYGEYGGNYSSKSPWSKHASHPPVIFDDQGNTYGRFTRSHHPNKNPASDKLLDMLKKTRLQSPVTPLHQSDDLNFEYFSW